jgi:hypothetical protein
MRKMNGEVYVSHAMRIFSHGPLGLHAQPFQRNFMPHTESPHKITDTTRKRSDQKFDRTEAGVLAAFRERLIGHHAMTPADDVIARSAVI